MQAWQAACTYTFALAEATGVDVWVEGLARVVVAARAVPSCTALTELVELEAAVAAKRRGLVVMAFTSSTVARHL